MDVEERIFIKLDKMEEKIDDLCNRITKQEVEFEEHLSSRERESNRKLRNRDLVIVLFGSIITTVEVFRTLGII